MFEYVVRIALVWEANKKAKNGWNSLIRGQQKMLPRLHQNEPSVMPDQTQWARGV